MKLIAGLGNPGPEYVWTRHNAGWIAADDLAVYMSLGEPRRQFLGAFWRASAAFGERVALLKPETFMNLSGDSVREAADYFDIEPSDILVIADDVALPFGRVRYRDRGSAGGQKGLASIIASLGTSEVSRLRIGVGAPNRGADMKNWVLGRFSSEQRDAWPKIFDLTRRAVELWIRGEAGRGLTLEDETLLPKKIESDDSDPISKQLK